MAPKKPDAVVITPFTIATGLSGDAGQQLIALGQLAAPTAAAFDQVTVSYCSAQSAALHCSHAAG